MKVFIYIFISLFPAAVFAASEKMFPEHVYVLSLDRTPERYVEADENLNKAKVPHTRFSATDGYKTKITDLNTKKIYDGKSAWYYCKDKKNDPKVQFKFEVICDNDSRNNLELRRCVSPGEIGVFCSMKRIWRDAYEKGYKTALILEDDSRIQPKFINSFKKNVSKIMSNTPLDWDVIFLHMYYKHEKTYPARKKGTKEQNEYVWGVNRDPALDVASCAAYIVNRSFISKMLNFSDIMDKAIDLKISEGINKRIINAYKAKEKLILPDEAEVNSVIKLMGRNKAGDLL